MPCWVMLPFIQCHQTRGRALGGGVLKPLRRGSAAAWAAAMGASESAPRRVSKSIEDGQNGFRNARMIESPSEGGGYQRRRYHYMERHDRLWDF